MMMIDEKNESLDVVKRSSLLLDIHTCVLHMCACNVTHSVSNFQLKLNFEATDHGINRYVLAIVLACIEIKYPRYNPLNQNFYVIHNKRINYVLNKDYKLD